MIVDGRYRHFRGGLYEIYGLVKHSETSKFLMLYRSIETGVRWVRPVDSFINSVTLPDGSVVPRFDRIVDGASGTYHDDQGDI